MGSVLGASSLDTGPWYEARSPGELIEFGVPVQRALQKLRVSAPRSALLGRRDAVLLGVLALLLHAGGLYWLGQRPTPVLPEVPVEVPPMSIEFSSPAPTPAPAVPTPAAAATPPAPTPPPPPVVDALAAKAAKPVAKPKLPPPPAPAKPKAAAKPVESRPAPAKAEATPAPAVASPAAPVVAAAPAAPAQAPLTPPSAGAGYLRNPAPDYPALAQRRGWEGTVLLRVHVLPTGKPSEIQIQTSSGRDLLDEAAVAAVQRWSFVPAKRGDVAQSGWVSVPIDFKLN